MHAFEPLPGDAAGVNAIRKQVADSLTEGTLSVVWLIAKLLIRYGPAVITVIEIMLVELGVRGGIKGLDPGSIALPPEPHDGPPS